MTGSNEESTTCCEPIEKKKKKQKHDDSKKNIVTESPCHNSENTKKKKKHKKEANVTEDASEIAEVLDEGDPISAKETRKKKKRKNVLGSSTCDPQAHDGVPKKKKKKNVAFCELRSIDPVHKKKEKNNALQDNKKFDTKKKKHKKSKPAENSSECNEAPETGNVTEVIQKKKVSELAEQSGSHTEDQSKMSTQAKVKKKKKATSMNTEIIEDKDVLHGEKSGYSFSVSQKKKVFEQEKELGSFIEEQSEMSKKAKVKKKKKNRKPTSMKTDYIVVEDHDVHHGEENSSTVSKKKHVCELEEVGSLMEDQSETKVKKKKRKATSVKANDVIEDHDVRCGEEGGDSLRVSKKKKKRKGSNIDAEAVHRESNLSGNSGKDSDITEGALRKKKKANKAKEKTDLMDCTDESSQVTCHEDEKKKSKGKKQKMLKHTDEGHSASEDTTEVFRKEKTSKEETEKAGKKQVSEKSLQENIDQESGNSEETQFGQWDTAAFQNSEQQTKFFRLMGGFKKGNQAPVTSASNKGKANMALKKEEEQNLARSLLAEFDKAVSWKQNRGIGLGFQPAQNKTFFIDKTASRSVKFED